MKHPLELTTPYHWLMSMRFRALFAGLLITASIVAVSATPAFAKSYQIDNVDEVATLNPDASMDVVEHITYVFDGEYHNATRTIPAGDYDITNMKVTENGQSLPFDGAPYNLAWHFSASNQTRTFDVAYHVNRAAKIGPDVGELYWKWRGTDHPQINHFKVVLTVPNGQGIRGWTHGPLNGQVHVVGNVITSEVSPLPASTFVETRVTDPSTSFTVAPTGGERLPQILAEESKNANDANATRVTQETVTVEHHPYVWLWNMLAAVATIAAGALFYFLWSRYGRDPKRPSNVGMYWYEAPDEAPAVVVATLHRGQANIAGTIVDLAQRGFLKIEETEDNSGIAHKIFGAGQDWRITKLKEPEQFQDFERVLFNYLFQDGHSITQSELKKRATKDQAAAKTFQDTFKSAVAKKVDGVYWKQTTTQIVANIAAAIALAAIGVFSLSHYAVLGAVAIVAAVAIGLATFLLRCRTELGAQKTAEWSGLRKYLKDFGNFKDAPVGHLVLWERYLVFAVAFGVAKELANGLRERIPDLQDNNNFATWYVASSGVSGLSNLASISAFGAGIGSAMAPPSSNSSDSSGFSGGGFSSGGGGGGGGGGDGAS